MLRNKVNSILNISGLAIAMACVIMIVMYVRDELSYDKFFANADHLFQLNMTITDNGVERKQRQKNILPTKTRSVKSYCLMRVENPLS